MITQDHAVLEGDDVCASALDVAYDVQLSAASTVATCAANVHACAQCMAVCLR